MVGWKAFSKEINSQGEVQKWKVHTKQGSRQNS